MFVNAIRIFGNHNKPVDSNSGQGYLPQNHANHAKRVAGNVAGRVAGEYSLLVLQ